MFQSTISAELRFHEVSEAPAIAPEQVEIWLVVAGNKGRLVGRTQARFRKDAIPQTMRLHLPTALFDRLKDDFNLPFGPTPSIPNTVGVGDDVIDQVGRSILSEIAVETPASRMYVETASLMLAARLLYKYCDSEACAPPPPSGTHGLDHLRLERVLDYIAANIKDDITLASLAGVAGYSAFHFARKFTAAMGVPPHRYIRRIRLENAMAELVTDKLAISEIALNAHFSSQASFTRAFRRVTGMTPKKYQRHGR